ncbi:MAG: hypothetical protein KC609_02960 [Myxococcales bacterium]|nr:hypothetical protein [Myxococcales bacterium]
MNGRILTLLVAALISLALLVSGCRSCKRACKYMWNCTPQTGQKRLGSKDGWMKSCVSRCKAKGGNPADISVPYCKRMKRQTGTRPRR